jgi:uncharacterized membrane protein
MAAITMEYIPYNTDVGFLRIKQDYIGIDHWRIAFFIHVYASMWVLLAGFTQFSSRFLKNNPRLHRILGYIYTVDVLAITGPAGLIMGFYAIVLLAVLWMYFTAMALVKAKQKDFKAHKNFMIRSYALTLSALTLRAWKYLITNAYHIDESFIFPPMDVYRIVAWVGWVGNLLFVEIFIIRSFRSNLSKKRSSQIL